ncbi:sodium-dependent proline transporter-like isoform X2 [Python bivittatus]|uniref:Transporter n=1 Tax=Python bivittatus TaxID=176946 RepID=A0A9F5INE5_PYTBI|nr:sodium-dependent proline transporter-like isoform X2 [Python bivittatus]
MAESSEQILTGVGAELLWAFCRTLLGPSSCSPLVGPAAEKGRVTQPNGAGLEGCFLPSTMLPQREPSVPVQDTTPAPEPSQPRETWGGKYEFLLSCLGYCVGLGNVWRFPYLCYRNGGGVFLIPYSIMLIFTGLPLFLMELSLGQYGAAGPISVWKCCPLLKGIGIGMLVVSSLVSLYYNVIIAWTFYYLSMSFQSPLPWSCDAPQNGPLCQSQNGSLANSSWASASEAFWNERVLGVVHSSGLGDPGPVRWPLALCLLLAWAVVFLCTLKGIRSSGKVVYFTATFPYVVMVVLIIRGATLEGSIEGVRFYLSADWSRLRSAQVWNDAASQIFYSLGIGFGGLLSMASYNKFDNNVIRDTLVIAIGNCCTSFFAGFAIFSILGHMAWRKKVSVGRVADSGPGLAFVAYPEALALLPGSVFWSILFFLMLFTLGVDTLFGNMEGITTAVMDEFPSLRDWRRKVIFLGGLCFAFYLLGLLLITEHELWAHLRRPLHVPRSRLLLRGEPVLPRHCRHDPAVPALVQPAAALLQGLLGGLHAGDAPVYSLLCFPGPVWHHTALRGIPVPAVGAGPGRLHGGADLHSDSALGWRGALQGVWDTGRSVQESHPSSELLAFCKRPRTAPPGH